MTGDPYREGDVGGAIDELPRVIRLRDATMIVVSSVIGVGIFFTPGEVAKLLPNAGWFFAAWAAGGLLALAGALANAELGAMFPKAGGNYVYLTHAYHPIAGFLVGWLQFFAAFAGTVATLAVGFTLSLGSFFDLTKPARMAIAVAVIWITTAVNAYATKSGATLNTATGYLKIAALVALVVLGPILGHAHVSAHPFASAGPATLSGFGAAMSPVVFSYLGWNASVYVAGEIESPGRNLPRSLFWGLGICTTIYVFMMAMFVYALGMPNIVGVPDAGFQVGKALFGGVGSKLVAALMLVSVFGCLNANVLVGPRIAYAMAKDGLFWQVAARVTKGEATPRAAVLVQSIAATLLVIGFGDDLDAVLGYTTFAIILATIADTISLYVLRVRQPARDRPYRAAGYPIVPALYIVANVGIAIAMAAKGPVQCVTGVLVLLVGAPVYWLFARRRAA